MEERAYAVYIVTNTRRGVLYTGVTGELITRGRQHWFGEVRGFTRQWGCKQLVWFEFHGDVSEAIRREKLIKRWRREWKFDLVERLNPDWLDLWPALAGGLEPYPWEGREGPAAIEVESLLFAAPAPRRGGSVKRTLKLPAVPDEPLRVFPG